MRSGHFLDAVPVLPDFSRFSDGGDHGRLAILEPDLGQLKRVAAQKGVILRPEKLQSSFLTANPIKLVLSVQSKSF